MSTKPHGPSAPEKPMTDFAEDYPSCPHPCADPKSATAMARNAFYGIDAHPATDRNTRTYLNGIGLPIKTKEAVPEIRRFVRSASGSTSRSRTPSINSLLHTQNAQESAEGTHLQHATTHVRTKRAKVTLVLHIVDHRNLRMHGSMASIVVHGKDSWMNAAIKSDCNHVVTVTPDNVASDIHIQLQNTNTAVDDAHFGYEFETCLSLEYAARAEGVREMWLNVFPPPIMVCGSGLSFRKCVADLGEDAPQIKVRCEVHKMEAEDTMTYDAKHVDKPRSAVEESLTLGTNVRFVLTEVYTFCV